MSTFFYYYYIITYLYYKYKFLSRNNNRNFWDHERKKYFNHIEIHVMWNSYIQIF